MLIRIRDTGAVMYENEFRAMYPDTSFPQVITPELLNDFGADPVLNGPQPTLTEWQYAQYVGVEEIDGVWFTKYIAVDYTPEQIEALKQQWRSTATCTPFQGRMALSNAGLLAQAQAAVDAGTEETKLAWEYAIIWERTSPLVESLGAALGLNADQIDDLFKAAQKITV